MLTFDSTLMKQYSVFMSNPFFEPMPSSEPDEFGDEADDDKNFEDHERRIGEIETITTAIMSDGASLIKDEDDMPMADWYDKSGECRVALTKVAYSEEGSVFYLTTYDEAGGIALNHFRFDNETYEAVRVNEREEEVYDDFIRDTYDATLVVHGLLSRSSPDTSEIIDSASYEERFWPLAATFALSTEFVAHQITGATTNENGEINQTLVESISAQILSVDTTTKADELDKQELRDILKTPEPERGLALDGLARSILSRGYDITDPEYITDAINGLVRNVEYHKRYGTNQP